MKSSRPVRHRIHPLLICAGFAVLLFLLMRAVELFFPNVKSAPEWIASIVFAITPVFCGFPGVIGCASAYLAALLFGGDTLELTLYLTISKLPIALAAHMSRKYAFHFCKIRQIASYGAFCVFGCFISFVLQCYYLQLHTNTVNGMEVYSILNLLTSNICCVIVYGMPICALIARKVDGPDTAAERSEVALVNTILLFIPMFTAIFLVFFSRCQPTFAITEEYLCKAFLYAAARDIQVVIVSYLLLKWKRQTLAIGSAFLGVIFFVGIRQDNPFLSLLIVAVVFVYVLLRVIYFARVEAALDARKPIRRVIIACNAVCIAIFMLVAALNTAVLVLPVAEENEAYTIILGAPVANGEPSVALRNRITTAASYAQRNTDTLFFITGGVKSGSANVSEADVIGNALIKANVPPERIIYEREALTTPENFKNIARIFENNGYDKDAHIVLLTSEFHSARAILCAKKAGFSNLVCVRTNWDFFSETLWSIREAIVFIPSLF